LSKHVESLVSEINDKMKDLKMTKIDKNQIGQAFIEWGMKVKEDSNS